MAEARDFEQAWLAKLSRGLHELAGADIRQRVMQGSEGLSSRSSRREVIEWSRQAMERLEALVDEERRRAILAGCACQYPRSDLQAIRQATQASGDMDLAHRMLQAQFEAFLSGVLHLEEPLIGEIVQRGWGSAGVQRGDRTRI